MSKTTLIALLVISYLGITGLSLLVLQSVAPSFAETQLLFIVPSLILFILIARLDYQLYTFSPWPWYIGSVLLLLTTLLIGTASRGAVRWISLAGFSLQTSELVKPMLIIFMATYLTQNKPHHNSTIISLFCLMTVPILLILFQPDLGSAVIFAALTFLSLVAAGTDFKKIFLVIVLGAAVLPISSLMLKPYQRQRIQSFIDPSQDPLGAGYNALQSTIAVGSGRIFGRGLGQGTQSHLRFLPERYSDFIFASLAEEMGFVGSTVLMAGYGLLFFALLKISRHANTDVGSLLCLLTIALILLQVIINMGMNMGMLPITGITLPLMSAGGSSYLSFSLLLAVTLSVALRPSHTRPVMEIG